MPSLAAKEFRQRQKAYDPTEDGLSFNGWYDVRDAQRIVWKKYNQLAPQLRQETLQPAVLFDGLDQLTLEEMLNPLIKILQGATQKYFPFLFKPELASVHYVAGFLRKNKDKTVSIVLFNPTGTLPRIDYGNYAYAFRLLDTDDESEFEKNVVYFEIKNKILHYSVIDPRGRLRTSTLTAQNLNDLKIELDLNEPLTTEMIRDKLKPKAEQIIQLLLSRGEAERKIEIISSPKKIQTHEKDGGRLVSCGPLSIVFIEYVMSHPEYMECLDKEFHLPDVLNFDSKHEAQVLQFLALAKNKSFNLAQFLDADNNVDFNFPEFLNIRERTSLIEYKKLVIRYRQFVTKVRQEHYNVLDTIEDFLAEDNGAIDDSYRKVTDAIWDSKNKEEKEIVDDYEWLEDEGSTDVWDEADCDIEDSVSEEEPVIAEVEQTPPVSLKAQKQITTNDIERTQPVLQTSTLASGTEVINTPLINTEQNRITAQNELSEKRSVSPVLLPQQKDDTIILGRENRADVRFIRAQINRFRENAKSFFSINNESKADAIERALELALHDEDKSGIIRDVRTDEGVRDALAIHRIFGFFGCKSTTAIAELEKSLEQTPRIG